MMRDIIKRMIPAGLLNHFRARRQAAAERRLERSSTQEVFTEIYARNLWGGAEGEFCSGPGSVVPEIVSPYVAMVFDQAEKEGFTGLRFVDLGCGDFRVGKQLLPLCSEYTGVDVVDQLVQFNQDKYGTEMVRFVQRDIVQQDLPSGDVCFIRQVLQHLSNEQISRILPKLAQYRWVYITEHHPAGEPAVKNVDKVHGGGIRASQDSGVYLDAPPFNLPASSLKLVLEVARTGDGSESDPGVLRTYLYNPVKFGE